MRHNGIAMRKKIITASLFSLLAFTSAWARPRWGMELQQQVSLLMAQLNGMQKDLDTNMAVMKSLISQNTDTVNKLTLAIHGINQSLALQAQTASQRHDELAQQLQALRDELAELRGRINRMNETLQQVQQSQQNLAAPAATPGNGAAAPTSGAGPGPGPASPAAATLPPDTLYRNALSDYVSGTRVLAQREFQQFLGSYPNDYHAPRAAFYLGDIYSREHQYRKAIAEYNAIIDRYVARDLIPAAQLKKSFALISLGQRAAAASELHSLIAHYPRTQEADSARRELRSLQATR